VVSASELHLGRPPRDFDVAGYLEYNADLRGVLATSTDVVSHYLRHGRREGRRYYPHSSSDQPSIEALADVAARRPECVVALYELAYAQHTAGHPDRAVATLRPAREFAPADLRTTLLFVSALRATGALEEAARVEDELASIPGLNAAELAVNAALRDYLNAFTLPDARAVLEQVGRTRDWGRTSLVAAEISAAITGRRGFALVQLGEGQGAHVRLGPEDEARFAALYTANREAWPDGGSDSAARASDEADICSVPGWPQLEQAYEARGRRYPSLLNLHRWLAVQEGGPLLCDQKAPVDLHARGLLVPLLHRAERLAVLSARNELADYVQGRFGLSGVERIRASAAPEAVLAQLAEPQNGRLVLLDGGPHAISYALQIKRSGGVALDVGSPVDAWAVLDLRPEIGATPWPERRVYKARARG
jgi:hypothetical protein